MGKWLIVLGILFLIFGILMILKIPIPLGKLPGDITLKSEHFRFYFPIVSSIFISILATILLYFFGK